MDTIFCNRCGQANLPNANYCMKCNNFINQIGATRNFNIKTKDNSKLYWIIGGISAALILGTLFVSIIGIGAYAYISANRNRVVYQPKETQNEPTIKVTNTDKKDDVLTKMTNEDVKNYINDDLKQVGKYKLIRTETPTPFFINAKTEQSGIYYPDDNKKDVVLFTMATFLSIADSKDFIEKKITAINQNSGKVTYQKNTPESDTLVYQPSDGIGRIIRCNKGICINIQATTSKDTADFYDAYQNMPTK